MEKGAEVHERERHTDVLLFPCELGEHLREAVAADSVLRRAGLHNRTGYGNWDIRSALRCYEKGYDIFLADARVVISIQPAATGDIIGPGQDLRERAGGVLFLLSPGSDRCIGSA